jgi:hypothetical protein
MKKLMIIVLAVLTTAIASWVTINEFNKESIPHSNSIELDLTVEGLTNNITRSTGETYTYPITINDGFYLISAKNWQTNNKNLPFILELISPEGEVKKTIISNKNKSPFFSLNGKILCGKNGYTLKISDQLNNIMVKSKIINSCWNSIYF